MTLRALSCPHCGAPISLRSTFCDYCRTPLHVPQLLEIDGPTDRRLLDFTLGAVPGGIPQDAAIPVRGAGVRITVRAGAVLRSEPGIKCRNASAALTGIVHDPDGGMDVGVRTTTLGKAQAAYLLRVRPAFGLWTIARLVAVPGRPAAYERLAIEQGLPELTGLEKPIKLELRVADTLLQARINDKVVGRVEDSTFGFGAQEWAVCSHGKPARVTVVAFEYGRL